jgi:hypothetical protein
MHWENVYYGDPATHQTGFLSFNGHRLPHLTLIKPLDPALDGQISVRLPGATHDTTEAELREWAWFLAESMAYAAGFFGFPGTRRRDSLYGQRMILVGESDAEPAGD